MVIFYQFQVVLSTLLALVQFSESSQGAPPENDHESFMRSFREFGRKLFPVTKQGPSAGEEEEEGPMESRSGKAYADLIPGLVTKTNFYVCFSTPDGVHPREATLSGVLVSM